MKIAVLGGGITGLTAAYYLSKKNYQVTVFEKSSSLGGLASGFKQSNWSWHLEYAYHHLFANDKDIINFAKEVNFNKIFFQSPNTDSIFDDLKIHPMDTPIDFFKLSYLDIFDKIRAGTVLASLKLLPFFKFYERQTAEDFIKKTMGEKVWNSLWQELFRKKFGDYAGIILASFIWARINKRTKKLGYIKGGFQSFINYLFKKLISLRVNVLTGYEIEKIKKKGEKYKIIGRSDLGKSGDYDIVISTLPTPILVNLTNKIFPAYFLQKLRKLKYLHALTLILETDKPLFNKTYWLNVSTSKIPIMVIVQHTNFIDKKYYGGKHISYLGWYLKKEDRLMNIEKDELIKYVKPYLRILNSKFLILNSHIFKGSFGQPIFDKEFIKNKPEFITPLKNFYIANLDMTYPYDRGTNYAVKLGKQVAGMI